MDIFNCMESAASKEVLFFNEPSVDLKAIVAINNITLGPSICSCRVFEYQDQDKAINDAINEAAYNAYSAALMNRDVGGGCAILVGDPGEVKSEMYFRSLGAFVDKFCGRVLLTGESGISPKDLLAVKKETDFVLGLPEIYGGSGDTSLSTAKGVIWGIKAAIKDLTDEISLKGLKVAVQGVGRVGRWIVEELINEGAEVVVTDLVYDKIKDIQDRYSQVAAVKPAEIFKTDCDVFCSSAISHAVTADAVETLKCKVVTGAVNRILEDDALCDRLREKHILFVPGFVVNSGEIIQVSNELMGFGAEKTEQEIKDIYFNTLNIILEGKEKKQCLTGIALERARDYIDSVATLKMLKC